MEDTPQGGFNILILGAGDCGVTTFIEQLMKIQAIDNIVRFSKCISLTFNTTEGFITFNIYEGYENILAGMDAIFLFFDFTRESTYNSLEMLYQKTRELSPNAAYVLCGNKIDLPNTEIRDVFFAIENNIQYYKISAKENINILPPVEFILSKLENREVRLILD